MSDGDGASDRRFLREAIALALEGVRGRRGGPFGALLVRDGRVLGRGCNRVTSDNDPTAHAEVVALREACRAAADFALPGATAYASCEPCPMCLCALWWARVDRIVYAASRHDAAAAGFDDEAFYAQLALPPAARAVPMAPLLRAEGLVPFRAWTELPDRTPY